MMIYDNNLNIEKIKNCFFTILFKASLLRDEKAFIIRNVFQEFRVFNQEE